MKNLKIKAFTFLFVFLSGITLSNAQDAKAKSLLNEVSTKVKSYKNMFIDFKYTLSNDAAGINQETRGDVTLNGDKYKLNLMGTTQMYDGKKLYTVIRFSSMKKLR